MIVLANVVLVASLLAIGGRYPALVSPGLLALGFGLRHGIEPVCEKSRCADVASMAWRLTRTVVLTSRRWRGG